MQKTILLGAALCLLINFPANAQTTFGQALTSALSPAYPSSDSRNNHYQYWHNIRAEQEMRDREHAREEARERDERDRGHHYAYGKDPKHHKKDWKHNSKKHHKNKHPKHHDHDHNRR